MNIISSDNAPKVIGPYSVAIETNGIIYTSGQIGVDPQSNTLADGIENQTKQVLLNLTEVLKVSGSDLQHVIKTTVFLSSMNDFSVMNTTYETMFSGHKPARSTVQVAQLPRNAAVEIEAVAEKIK